MTNAWRFVRTYWWVFVAAASGILLFAWRLMASRGPGVLVPVDPPVTFTDRAREQVERVRLEGEVEKAKVNVTADVAKAELERIEEVGKIDPRAARRQLSSFLNGRL